MPVKILKERNSLSKLYDALSEILVAYSRLVYPIRYLFHEKRRSDEYKIDMVLRGIEVPRLV